MSNESHLSSSCCIISVTPRAAAVPFHISCPSHREEQPSSDKTDVTVLSLSMHDWERATQVKPSSIWIWALEVVFCSRFQFRLGSFVVAGVYSLRLVVSSLHVSVVFSVSRSECYMLTSFVSVSPRLLETDDTTEPNGKMNSTLSTKSNLLFFHRLCIFQHRVMFCFIIYCWYQITYLHYRYCCFNAPSSRSVKKTCLAASAAPCCLL